jgi:hypothetical protein
VQTLGGVERGRNEKSRKPTNSWSDRRVPWFNTASCNCNAPTRKSLTNLFKRLFFFAQFKIFMSLSPVSDFASIMMWEAEHVLL